MNNNFNKNLTSAWAVCNNRHALIKLYSALLLLITIVSVGNSAEVTRVQYLMGTVCEIQASGQIEERLNAAISKAFLEMARLESILSTYKSESELSLLNKRSLPANYSYSPDLFELLKKSLYFSQVSDGAFDVTLRDKGYQKITLDAGPRTISIMEAGLTLDFGGIGKGYALDKAAEILRKEGVSEAILNFSGNILNISDDPKKTFPVVISNPIDPKKILKELVLPAGSVSTSSQIEKKGHIVDPRTGKAAPFHGVVTVTAPTATQADALSTTLFVLGPEKGQKLIKAKFPESKAYFFEIQRRMLK